MTSRPIEQPVFAQGVCMRPEMYLGECSLRDILVFLFGVACANVSSDPGLDTAGAALRWLKDECGTEGLNPIMLAARAVTHFGTEQAVLDAVIEHFRALREAEERTDDA